MALLIIETPAHGFPRNWTARDEGDFVLKVAGKNPKSGTFHTRMEFEHARKWLAEDLRALEIHKVPDEDVGASANYPAGLTGESAYYAADGPRDQQLRELVEIERRADAWPTFEAGVLAREARAYLDWLGDHESCADMLEGEE